jgi:hypothetical protein
MENLLSPQLLDALGKASGFAILSGITGLIIYALIQTIKNANSEALRNNEETKMLLALYSENIAALKSLEKVIASMERTSAQNIGAIEAQGVLASQVSNNLVTLEKSFRDHNNAVAETLGVLSTNIVDLEAFFKRRTDELLERLDKLPADVGLVVKEHIAAMLLQSTPPPKITGEVAKAILADATKKPPLQNGAAIETESQKGVD